MSKTPMFLQFLNKERGVSDLLTSFSKSSDETTARAAKDMIKSPPDLDSFRDELKEAVIDILTNGLGDTFKAFVNDYMSALQEDYESKDTKNGMNMSHTATVADPDGPWIQGFICYNLCLYIKAFGLENVKMCRVCHKIFSHKGKWAVYCSDPCKKKGKEKREQEGKTGQA